MSAEILAIIPARGGSKGVKRKNIRIVGGKPLLTYTIEAALNSKLLSRFLVSTEDLQIAEIARSFKSEVQLRPENLAYDNTATVPVIQHVLRVLAERESYVPDITVILQPTTPLRQARHIDESLELLLDSGAASVVSVTESPGHYNPNWQFTIQDQNNLLLFNGKSIRDIYTRRQNLPKTYIRNGAIYAFKSELITEHNTIYGDPCKAYVMKENESVNIDSEFDLFLAEKLLNESPGKIVQK